MIYLTEGLPTYVEVNHKKIELNTDYRAWIEYEQLMLDENKTDKEQLEKILKVCLKDKIFLESLEQLEELFEGFLWFYALGKDFKENNNKKDEESDYEKPSLVYSFEHDWSYIYSAFIECYNINLFTAKLHWWEFKALFESLNEKCLFSKILSYRSIKISSKMSKDEKKFYRNMKKIYALPDQRTAEEKERSFARSMMASMQI